MVAPAKLNFKIYQGSTFNEVLRWESSTKVYKTITAVAKSAPLIITAPAHGIPVGWRAKVVGVGGMKELNTDEYVIVSEATSDSVTINAINSLGYTTYTSGGVLEYNQPMSLSGITARMQIREKLNSTTTIDSLTTENGGIVVSDVNKTITINISATTTEAYNFKSGVYSLELISGATVIPFVHGSISLDKEVTR